MKNGKVVRIQADTEINLAIELWEAISKRVANIPGMTTAKYVHDLINRDLAEAARPDRLIPPDCVRCILGKN